MNSMTTIGSTVLGLFGIESAGLSAAVVLSLWLLYSLRKRGAIRGLEIFEIPVEDAWAALRRRWYGPDWDDIEQSIRASARFLNHESPDESEELFRFHSNPRTLYEKERQPRICIFFCQGIRPLVPWIDYMYFRLIEELRRQGATVLVLFHNDDFEKDRDGMRRPTHVRSSSAGFVELKSHLSHLFGPGLVRNAHLGKEFLLAHPAFMKQYISFIYDDVTSLYAAQPSELATQDSIPDAKQFANLIDGFACSSLRSPRKFVLYLGWEQQTRKWIEGPLSALKEKLANGFILGNTIKQENNNRVNVYDSDTVLNIFDKDDSMASKLFGAAGSNGDRSYLTDITTVRNICIGLAAMPAANLNYEVIRRNTSRVDLDQQVAKYQRMLREHRNALTEQLREFADTPYTLNGNLDLHLGNELIARCTAYTTARALRDALTVTPSCWLKDVFPHTHQIADKLHG